MQPSIQIERSSGRHVSSKHCDLDTEWNLYTTQYLIFYSCQKKKLCRDFLYIKPVKIWLCRDRSCCIGLWECKCHSDRMQHPLLEDKVEWWQHLSSHVQRTSNTSSCIHWATQGVVHVQETDPVLQHKLCICWNLFLMPSFFSSLDLFAFSSFFITLDFIQLE